MASTIAFQKRLLASYVNSSLGSTKLQKPVWFRANRMRRLSVIITSDPKMALTLLGDEPEPPLKPMLICGDPTLEGWIACSLRARHARDGLHQRRAFSGLIRYECREQSQDLRGAVASMGRGLR